MEPHKIDEQRPALHGKLSWPSPDLLDDDQLTLYNKITGGPRSKNPVFPITDPSGRLEGPFNAMLLNPMVGDAVQQLGAAIRYQTGFPDRSREIAILTLSLAERSYFEFYAHERIGIQAGLTEAEIDTLRQGTIPATFSAEESLIQTTVVQLWKDRDLDDESHTRFTEIFGEQRLGELLTLVSYYELLALSMRVWRTPLPDGEVTTL